MVIINMVSHMVISRLYTLISLQNDIMHTCLFSGSADIYIWMKKTSAWPAIAIAKNQSKAYITGWHF